MANSYDLIVLGAGSGGVRCARMAASYGARVAVIESTYLGGTCVNVGCVPKKLFVYGSHFAEEFDNATGYGWQGGERTFHWPTLRDNKTREIERLNGVYRTLLDNAGVDIIWGHGEFVDAHRIKVSSSEGDDQQLYGEKILIATGGRPVVPEFPGSELAITSDDAFYLGEFPADVAVVGGGYIGVEFAGIFNGLGANTHLIYRGEMFLRGFDDGVRHFVRDELASKGIDLRFQCNVERIELDKGRRRLALTTGESLVVDQVMYATGRVPNVAKLNLAAAGVETTGKGAVAVDDDYQTNVPNIYALGDVIDRVQLTPVAIAEGMVIANNLFTDNPRRSLSYDNIATAVFCQPNIGTVGLTEAQANARFDAVDVYESSFRPMKYTLTESTERTLMKLIVDRGSDRVVGAHMAGPDAGEIIQGLAIAVNAGLTKAQFDATVGIHPTAAEEFVTMREARA
jgi:glutathione reductase (NADPH)